MEATRFEHLTLPWFSAADVDGWIQPEKPEWRGQHRSAIDKLELLGILHTPDRRDM